MINFSDLASQLNMSKVLAMALPRFYQRTKISAKFIIEYNIEMEGIEFALAFTPNEPTDAQYNILFEELFDAEHLLLNQYIVNNAHNYDNVKQLFSKHKEEMNQIIEKHRKTRM